MFNDDFPEEMIQAILQFTDPITVRAISQVSKEGLRHARDLILWKNIIDKNFSEETKQKLKEGKLTVKQLFLNSCSLEKAQKDITLSSLQQQHLLNPTIKRLVLEGYLDIPTVKSLNGTQVTYITSRNIANLIFADILQEAIKLTKEEYSNLNDQYLYPLLISKRLPVPRAKKLDFQQKTNLSDERFHCFIPEKLDIDQLINLTNLERHALYDKLTAAKEVEQQIIPPQNFSPC